MLRSLKRSSFSTSAGGGLVRRFSEPPAAGKCPLLFSRVEPDYGLGEGQGPPPSHHIQGAHHHHDSALWVLAAVTWPRKCCHLANPSILPLQRALPCAARTPGWRSGSTALGGEHLHHLEFFCIRNLSLLFYIIFPYTILSTCSRLEMFYNKKV